MSQKLRLVPIAAIAAIAAAGCGSQSHKPSPLVAAADPICQTVAAQTASANAALREVSTSTAKTLHVLARVAPGIASSEHRAVDMLGALRQSGSQTDDWHTMLLGLRQLADVSTQLAAAARAKNLGDIHQIIAGGVKIQRELAIIAARDGFAYCGRAH
jgi:hypothetical protein